MPPTPGAKNKRTETMQNLLDDNDIDTLDSTDPLDAAATWDGPIRIGQGPTLTQQAIIDRILLPIAPVVEDEDIDEDVDLAIEPVVDIAPVVAAPKSDPVYALAVVGPKPKAGFETVLVAELAKGPGTATELVARMMASGEFVRVAPKAAANRPLKPTNFLLKTWTANGTVIAS